LEKRKENINSIEDEFKTGLKLITFLEILLDKEIKCNKQDKIRVHWIENNNIAINFLRTSGLKDLSISAEEIVDGNLKMILGMCWVLLKQYGKRHKSGENDSTSFEDSMLKWAKEEVKDYGLDVSSFKTSFNDGKVFLALCHKLNPNTVDYYSMDMSNSIANSTLAFKITEEQLKVPILLNPENLSAGKEQEKSIVLYISLLYNAYTNEQDKRKLEGFTENKTSLSLQERITMVEEENTTIREKITVLSEKVHSLQKMSETKNEELIKMNRAKNESMIAVKQERENLKMAKEKIEKEKEAIATENVELLNQLKKSEKQREKLEEMLANIKKENRSNFDEFQKALTIHLRHLNVWKNHFKTENKEFESEKIQLLKDKEIQGKDAYGQLGSVVSSIAHEDLKLEVLRKEKESKEAIEKENLVKEAKEKELKEKEMKEKESKEKESKEKVSKEKEPKKKESKEKVSKEKEPKEKESKDKDSKDKEPKEKESKEKESKDKEPKEKESKEKDDKKKKKKNAD